jgi:hypothetical protein
MEDGLREEVQQDVHQNEDDYYEDLIPKLYKPVKKATTMGQVIQQTIDFEVDSAAEPEPAEVSPAEPGPESKPESVMQPVAEHESQQEPEPDTEPEKKQKPAIIERWSRWLNDLMNSVTE